MLKFKLDENFSSALAALFAAEGIDAETVLTEQLSGASDAMLYEVCKSEGRCLITLDLDFANILRFPVEDTPGIIVVRPKQPVTLMVMTQMLELLMKSLENQSPKGSLWILEPHQLRVRKSL